MNKEKEIGEFFKEELEGYRKEPPTHLWDAIQNDPEVLKYNRHCKMVRRAKWTVVAAVATVAAIAIAVVALLPSSSQEPAKTNPSHVQKTSSISVASETENVLSIKEAPLSSPEQNSSTPSLVSHQVKSAPTAPHSDSPDLNFQKTNYIAATETDQVPQADSPSLNQSPHADTPTEAAPGTPVVKQNLSNAPSVSSPIVQPKVGSSKPLEYSNDTSVCRGSKLVLFVKNAMDVHWNIGLTGESITVFPDAPMFVEARVTTFDKVDTTIYMHIGVFECGLWIPTAFTPNGDGLNDEFIIHAPADITNYECTIFDRARGMLFRTNNIMQGWDGKFNGNPLPFGAYFYIITYRDALGEKHVEKGQITLVR